MLVGLPALLEAEALPVHLQDMDMVSKAIEEGPGEPFRAKDISPLFEGQVGGSQDHLKTSRSVLRLRAISQETLVEIIGDGNTCLSGL